ncbi:DddA-like double-stranded DNA deaminase toxin [Glycomyces tritici]|uniref:SCP1.201-like deaminase n=1 Tax=Glycomyces tritici TaxID=2665176 RepID=A0ABT7YV44_9ACTN|nr:DddA-like double-stranded DNA deaminase toxin [Glycomyces tritici]MDN3241383.1 SCP1.201-like deaminase [Glycomyces tritici]MDN3242133.1 SCP1.201-like deaminase [Glycomyces tritici]
MASVDEASGAAGASSAPSYDPKARDPARVEAIRREGWPRNVKGRTSALGLLYDGAGKPVLRQPLRPLSGDRVYDTPDLKDEWRLREVATSWHIEGGVAAYMRKTTTMVMTLWLNIPTCGGYRRPDPNGCHENLPKVLPPGYTLHVRVEGEDGSYQLNTYRGTGEALKRSE